MGAGLRPTLKCVELPPDPKVRAPVPHPTDAYKGVYKDAKNKASLFNFPWTDS